MTPEKSTPAIYWFRDDLRLADNPALRAAIETGAPVLCLFIFDEESKGIRPHGGASRWWLHHALHGLADALHAAGGRLDILQGASGTLVPEIVAATKARAVFWNRRYGAAEIAIDAALKKQITEDGVSVESFNGALLHEPWDLKTKTGGPFKVYTPYWRATQALEVDAPLPAPGKIEAAAYPRQAPKRRALADLDLLPTKPDWAGGLRDRWQPGEKAAQKILAGFVDRHLEEYPAERDRPANQEGTSNLSPYLRFGEISPRAAFHAADHKGHQKAEHSKAATKFLAELTWRDFAYQTLFTRPDLASENVDDRFDKLPWRRASKAEWTAWTKGRTGYPIVDAGMRELWKTGYMHNRVRMIAGSFLVKDMLVDWREGEKWFWDTLCDADPANNALNWQWVGGTGADNSPFFRVFNPVLQGEKFDPDGNYVRRYVPELAALPAPFIHKPWEASSEVLAKAKIEIGKTYPKPIVDHGEARDRALAAFQSVK